MKLLVSTVALLCVARNAAHDIFNMDKDALHELFQMSTERSEIDRRLADPSQDDATLRELIAGTGLPELCITGTLRNVGTPAEPEIGCCNGECYMCMARGCGLFNSMVDIATLQFPGIAPQCCYEFRDYQTDMDRGINTRECVVPEDTGCMLPDAYNALGSVAPSGAPAQSVVAVVETTLFANVADPMTPGEFESSMDALFSAMGSQTNGIGSENFNLEGIDILNDRRLRVVSVRKLQGGGRQTFGINLTVDKEVSSLPPDSPSPFPAGITEEEAEAEIESQIDGMDLVTLGSDYVNNLAGMIPDNDLLARLETTTFVFFQTQGAGVPVAEPSAAPSTIGDRGAGADSRSVSQGSITNNNALALCLLGFGVLVVGGAGCWYRKKSEKKSNQAALLQLKVDPNAAFSGILSDDYDSVYLPPVLPGRTTRTSSQASVDRSSTPRSASRSRAGSGRHALRRQLSNRSMRSVSETSDRSGPASDRRMRSLLVVNELEMLTDQQGPESFDGSSTSSDTASTYSSRS